LADQIISGKASTVSRIEQNMAKDEKMMDASNAEMLYCIDEQLSIISEYLTIEPGDILFTGSPSGSAGVHGDRFLQPGDRIHAEIESIGNMDITIKRP
jgi:2,4-didehydro-3-deoxy-L-rhamnonate hydrolase